MSYPDIKPEDLEKLATVPPENFEELQVIAREMNVVLTKANDITVHFKKTYEKFWWDLVALEERHCDLVKELRDQAAGLEQRAHRIMNQFDPGKPPRVYYGSTMEDMRENVIAVKEGRRAPGGMPIKRVIAQRKDVDI